MSIQAMYTAQTGLTALSDEIDITANNLANVNTTGFKRSRANFEDLFYLEMQRAEATNGTGISKPAGTYIGLGTQISNTQLIFTQGSAIGTDSSTDMMIMGNGLFRVRTSEDIGGGLAYTRSGNFFPNRDGQLVLGNSDGYLLEPPITIPPEATNVQIQTDGTVQVFLPGQTQPQIVGQILLYRFSNQAGLASYGSNVLTATEASGQAIEGAPGTNGLGQIRSNYLEASNVDAVKELVALIKTQRAFELNSQVITAGNEMLQTITRLR